MNLNVRYQSMQSTCPDDNVEANIVSVDAVFDLDPAETALVLVDVWGWPPYQKPLRSEPAE